MKEKAKADRLDNPKAVIHSTKEAWNWPEVVYVSQGAVTEYRGGQSSDYRTGDTFQAGKDTTHWLENKGTAPLVIIVADIFKQP